jgi:competence ComEA-like helix-hairpin-helix protein
MHADETRALKRAALILLAVSVARWGWSLRSPPRGDPGATALPELLGETTAATEEGVRRRTPLDDNERIDPNRASDVDLDRLPGVGPATARAIVAARDSGAVFRRAEDLLEVRGIGEATLERMRGFLVFSAPAGPSRRSRGQPATPTPGLAGVNSAPLVDINRADLDALQELPGIGPALAARIVAARQERMFSSLEDLDRVPGIGPATIERLRPRATVGRSR